MDYLCWKLPYNSVESFNSLSSIEQTELSVTILCSVSSMQCGITKANISHIVKPKLKISVLLVIGSSVNNTSGAAQHPVPEINIFFN